MFYAQHFNMLDENNKYYEVSMLKIPDTIKQIGKFQFCGFKNISSILIPQSVINICSGAFFDCVNLINVYYDGTIDDWCKFDLSNVMRFAQHIYMLENKEYHEVTHIRIPDNIINLQSLKFYGFRNVNSVTLPSSLIEIDYHAFEDCLNLKNIYYEGTINQWTKINDYSLFNYANHLYIRNVNNEFSEVTLMEILKASTEIKALGLWNSAQVTDIIIPDNVINIGDKAFEEFKHLKNITIPESVTSIGQYAFSNCTNLVNITIPSSVVYIGSWAFNNCTNLKTILFKSWSQLRIIGEYAFSGCTSLRTITIPSTITSLLEDAFFHCTSLIIYCEATSKHTKKRRSWTSSYNPYYRPVYYWGITNNNYVKINDIEYVLDLNNSTATISRYTGNSTIVEIPLSIKHNGIEYRVSNIGKLSFSECANLESLIIPLSIVNISKSAFLNCDMLKELKIPENFIDDIASLFNDSIKQQLNNNNYQNDNGFICIEVNNE